MWNSAAARQTLIVFGSHDHGLYCLKSDGQLLWKHTFDSAVYSTPFVFKPHSTDSYCSPCKFFKTSCNSSKTDGSYLKRRLSFPDKNTNSSPAEVEHMPRKSTKIAKKCDTNNSTPEVESVVRASSNTAGVLDEKGNTEIHLDSASSDLPQRTLVCVCSTMGRLSVIDLLTGEAIASENLPGELFSSPVCHGNKILVGCRDDYVYCFKICRIKFL